MEQSIAKKSKTSKKVASKKLKTAKPHTKKVKVNHMVFSQVEHTKNEFDSNVIYRMYKGTKKLKVVDKEKAGQERKEKIYKEKIYNRYSLNYYLKRGRSLYEIHNIYFYNDKGVKFDIVYMAI